MPALLSIFTMMRGPSFAMRCSFAEGPRGHGGFAWRDLLPATPGLPGEILTRAVAGSDTLVKARLLAGNIRIIGSPGAGVHCAQHTCRKNADATPVFRATARQ
ncbi:hypothetical protein GCM10008956_36540 [Deinococcus arenae]|uniref:Uncharacterized protein n=1 Tax=Deinococcus arenae TaxID=1452751 RepID=A0A8H9L8H9_9DEIO|nr:hypothetical protein GCM10008956_36540 [Deinococcus arenae]